LSGALCTVIVRTALNPLELIKTKQQLQSDTVLFDFARDRIRRTRSDCRPNGTVAVEPDAVSDVKIGTIDMIKCLVALRGPLALFQSSDITFLASLVFGSFGFGATELFRRSFTEFFFAGGGGSEIVLLLAAALATVITSAAASPFEVLRVRSMGQLESTSWLVTLQDFLVRTSRQC
jgi:Mitochondrial carrier protein